MCVYCNWLLRYICCVMSYSYIHNSCLPVLLCFGYIVLLCFWLHGCLFAISWLFAISLIADECLLTVTSWVSYELWLFCFCFFGLCFYSVYDLSIIHNTWLYLQKCHCALIFANFSAVASESAYWNRAIHLNWVGAGLARRQWRLTFSKLVT